MAFVDIAAAQTVSFTAGCPCAEHRPTSNH